MKLLLISLLAAVVSFFWGFVSWMVLDWHETGIRDFKDEAAVAQVIKDNATHGKSLYMLPYQRRPLSIASDEEKAQAQADHEKAAAEGPYMYAIVRPGKHEGSMYENMLMGFGRSFIACLLVGALLSQTVLAYIGRVCFVAAAGVFAGVAVEAQQWIWFELPLRDLIVNMSDHCIEWTLVGFVMGAFLGREPTDRDYK